MKTNQKKLTQFAQYQITSDDTKKIKGGGLPSGNAKPISSPTPPPPSWW